MREREALQVWIMPRKTWAGLFIPLGIALEKKKMGFAVQVTLYCVMFDCYNFWM